ncbi:MAG: Flp family type IVb pilin [Thermoleophilia bacterium]|nr:Flp family type IVb pilin [Thermoleophilia bacterium]
MDVLHDDSGQALLEYAVIVMLVALICVTALTSIGGTINGFLSSVATKV